MDKTLKNTSIYLTQIGISGIILFISLPIITHQLSSELFGEFVLTHVYIAIVVGIANLGLSVGYERNFFIYENNPKQSAQLLYSALAFVMVNLFCIFLPLFIWRVELSEWMELPLYDELLILVFIGSACSTLAQYYLTYLKNKGLAKSFLFFMLLQTISNFMLIVGLLFWTNLGIFSLAYALFVSNLLLIIGLFVYYYQKLPLSLDLKLLKPMLKISLPLTPKIFLGVLATHFDKIMLGMIGSTSLVGVYQIGQTVALTVFQFMTGLDRVFKPEIYRKLFANKHQTHSQEINHYTLPFFWASIFIALCVSLFAKEIMIVFFPIDYWEAVNVIIILSLYYALLFFGKIIGTQLIYAEKTFVSMGLILFGVVVNVSLNIPLIIHWGIVGAAIATAITGITVTGIGYVLAQKYAFIDWQWQKINVLHAIFIVGVVWALVDYNNWMNVHYLIAIFIKLGLLSLYILAGFKLNIVNKNIISLKGLNL